MGNLDLVRLLLDLSLPADPANPTGDGSGNFGSSLINARDGISGRTPLHIAAANNHAELVALLLAVKATAAGGGPVLSPDGNRQAATAACSGE